MDAPTAPQGFAPVPAAVSGPGRTLPSTPVEVRDATTGGTLPYTGVSLWLLLLTSLLALVVGTSLTVASSRRRTG